MPPTSFPGQYSDSPQTVLCNVTQLFARGKSVMLWMPPTQSAWPNIQVDQKGADEIFSDSAQDTSLTLQSANVSNTSVVNLWLTFTDSHGSFNHADPIALLITRQSSSRPRPLLAE